MKELSKEEMIVVSGGNSNATTAAYGGLGGFGTGAGIGVSVGGVLGGPPGALVGGLIGGMLGAIGGTFAAFSAGG
jgi:hypothetical protein